MGKKTALAALYEGLKSLGTREVPRNKAFLKGTLGLPEDMAKSLMTDEKARKRGYFLASDLRRAGKQRETLLNQPATTPGPDASPEEWLAWGREHDVDLSETPMVPVAGQSGEVMVPGGLEGTFTLADVFRMKGQQFDPNELGQDTHTKLMQKFLRTYQPEGYEAGPAQKFNALNFAQLSPNA